MASHFRPILAGPLMTQCMAEGHRYFEPLAVAGELRGADKGMAGSVLGWVHHGAHPSRRTFHRSSWLLETQDVVRGPIALDGVHFHSRMLVALNRRWSYLMVST